MKKSPAAYRKRGRRDVDEIEVTGNRIEAFGTLTEKATRSLELHTGPYQATTIVVTREDLCEASEHPPLTPGATKVRPTDLWRPGDHVMVTVASAARPGYRTGLERQRAVLVEAVGSRRAGREFVFVVWRIRWVDAAGTLGNEAVFDERDLTWVRPVPTREPPYRSPARKRYGVGV